VTATLTLPLRLLVLGAFATAMGGCALLIGRRITSKHADHAWDAFEPLLAGLSTAIQGRVELIAASETQRFLGFLTVQTGNWGRAAKRAAFTSFLAGRAPALAVGFLVGGAFVLDEGLRGTLSRDVLGQAALLASMTLPFSGLARAWLEMGKSFARVSPICNLLGQSPGAQASGAEDPQLPAVLALNRVSFGYELQSRVLQERTAAFQPGEVSVLIGPNGSGKSTLLALLLGLVEPNEGVVSVSGIALSQLSLDRYRHGVGYLSQRPFLPDKATVEEALRLLAPEARAETLRDALERVDLWRVLAARTATSPLDVKVGSLSAGEKQRLALARVIARGAPILLLDEPDANLDAEGVELVAQLLRELAPGRVVVVAAHSSRIVSAADRVVSLGDDEPAEVTTSAVQRGGEAAVA
jgi:ABC-type multidrug transport system fused ATPase/permease subunit